MAQASVRGSRSSLVFMATFMATFVVVAGTVFGGGGVAPAVAQEIATVSGSAYSYATEVSRSGSPAQVRGYGQPAEAPQAAHSPAVACPDGGGADVATDPDGARAEHGPGVLFGGMGSEGGLQAPPSGPLTSEIDCRLGEGGHARAATSVVLTPPGTAWTAPDGREQAHPGGVGPGPLVAGEVHSSCVATAEGVSGAVTIVGGVLEIEHDERTGLATVTELVPQDPAPNSSREGTLDHTGERYRITFNEQVENPDGTLTVNAARVELLGPDTLGEIVIGSATCGVTAKAPPPVTPAQWQAGPAEAPAGAAQWRSEEAPGAAAAAAAQQSSAAAASSAETAEPEGTMEAAQAPSGGDMVGRAYNYYTDVGLFGGPSNRRGFGQASDAPDTASSPAVECPGGGGSDSATDPDGASARYGPATIFGGIWPEDSPSALPSGPLTSEVDCEPGEQVTASTSVTLMPAGSAHPGGVGPGPLVADEVHSSCTATDAGITTDVRFVGGILETRYDAETQLPVESEPIPENPAPNTVREGTIDHVGDSYRITFNQQIENADGSVTVNAAHMELLGPVAVGDMVVGSATCGLEAAAAGGTNGGTGGGTDGGTDGGGNGDGTNGDGSSRGTDGRSGTSENGRLARSGSAALPLAAMGLGLLLAGVLTLQWGRRRGRRPAAV